MQYPSVYGLGRNVSVDPSMKVKPFVFLIELWQDPRLGGYLTCLDIAVAVVYGRTHKCHDICVEKILKVRETGDLATVIESVDDVRTPKRYHDIILRKTLPEAFRTPKILRTRPRTILSPLS